MPSHRRRRTRHMGMAIRCARVRIVTLWRRMRRQRVGPVRYRIADSPSLGRLTLGAITLETRLLCSMAALAAPLLRGPVHTTAPTATLPRSLDRQGLFRLLGRHHAVLEAIAHIREIFRF